MVKLIPAVVITGCDSGFGHQVAKELHRKGLFVFATCLDPQNVRYFESLSYPALRSCLLDVTNEASIQNAVTFVRDTLAVQSECSDEEVALYALVNNAGIFAAGMFEMQTVDTWKKVFDVNVFGCVRVCLAFTPMLRRWQSLKGSLSSQSNFLLDSLRVLTCRRRSLDRCQNARILTVSSVLSVAGLPGASSYSSSKFALSGAMEALRRELSIFGIHVITAEPGGTKTSLYAPLQTPRAIAAVNANCPPETLKAYGEDFHSRLVHRFSGIMSTVANHPRTVVRALVGAVIAPFPPAVVRAGWDVIFWNATASMPKFISDSVFAFLWYLFPTPQSIVDEKKQSDGGSQPAMIDPQTLEYKVPIIQTENKSYTPLSERQSAASVRSVAYSFNLTPSADAGAKKQPPASPTPKAQSSGVSTSQSLPSVVLASGAPNGSTGSASSPTPSTAAADSQASAKQRKKVKDKQGEGSL